MDILGILNTIKGKVLDAAHFELLQSAYGLQDENIKQLKENNLLLKEKNNDLLQENSHLKQRLAVLETQLIKQSTIVQQKLSETAKSILSKCKERDMTSFSEDDMQRSLSYSKMQFETGLDELIHLELIRQNIAASFRGSSEYELTPRGKRLAQEV